ncbi:acetylglutamate kinase [Kitasatospora purpeofusca]|uniref:acetylglutamate kinase n=1 Tax=Kitasatospora purpeofusca TaxID=67352 RepID=UPI003BF4E279
MPVGAAADLLPRMRELRGRTVVIKIGGHVMTRPRLTRAFAQDVTALRYAGLRPVVVHGGGPQIDAHLKLLGLVPEFRAGLRVTTGRTMDVVRMVLVGQVQRSLVGLLNEFAPIALGLTGEDVRLMTAVRRDADDDGRSIDIGFVGDVVDVNEELLVQLLDSGLVPVISGIAAGKDGQVYNINADTAAAALAAALGADRLTVLTDVDGVYADWPDPLTVVRRLTVTEARRLGPDLSEGMRPKLLGCLRAVAAGVGVAHIINGGEEHALLSSLLDNGSMGTTLVPDSAPA